MHPIKDYTIPFLSDIDRVEGGRGKGWELGCKAFDDYIYGFMPGQFVVMASRPSIGKTSLALWMAHSFVFKGISAALISLEMNEMEIMQKLISIDSGVDSIRIRSGYFTKSQKELITKAVGLLQNVPLFLDTPTRASTTYIEAKIANCPAKIIFIDYIGLVRQGKNQGRTEEVEEVSRELKIMAEKYQKTIVALSQLSRDSEGRKPSLADLKQSGALEQDANIVILLHGNKTEKTREVMIEKNRGGRTGMFTMRFEAAINTFEEIKEKREDD